MKKKILFLCVLVLLATPVFAHLPGLLNAVTFVERPKISQTLAGEFVTGEEVFVMKMTFDEPFVTPFEVMTFAKLGNEEFRPRYAIVGPGLPLISKEDVKILPPSYRTRLEQGMYLEKNDRKERLTFFEEIMRRNYYTSGAIAIPLQQGNYEVWVWSPEKKRGRFQFAFGVEEDFSDGGFADVFANWSVFAY